MFEWDDVKESVNLQKHGVLFDEAQRAFLDPNRIILNDKVHSQNEQRFYCVGLVDLCVMTVRFTYRENAIRIIGAGYWRKGRKIYEKNRKTKSSLH